MNKVYATDSGLALTRKEIDQMEREGKKEELARYEDNARKMLGASMTRNEIKTMKRESRKGKR
jgi:hypothetical protein